MTTSHASQVGYRPGDVAITVIGGPTAMLGIGGLRLLTDPTFDAPGDHRVGARTLTKTSGPAIAAEDLGAIDAVLLSHDQHPDNLDETGRRVVSQAPLVLSTGEAADRLGGTTCELSPWKTHVMKRPDGGELLITGVPAHHGPAGTEHITGQVRGFVLHGQKLPTIYVSGDNASLPVVRDIADHAGPIDISILFAGRARTPVLDAYLTFGADQAAEAAEILGSPVVIPLHVDGWAHLTQSQELLAPAFEKRGLLHRLLKPEPGICTGITVPRAHAWSFQPMEA